MATSEIEKLERRYAENPHGLTFAPLAEVYRKNGDISRALDLLRIGLELHPNYIPASIVLGRCHQDLGDLQAAAEAFAHVLRLDDENVIALKSLADINERLGRLDDAERSLRRLVSVDRSNDEARQQLERVESAKEQGSRAAQAAAITHQIETPAEAPASAPSAEPEPVAPEPELMTPEPQPVAPQPEPVAVQPAPAAVEPVPTRVEPEPIRIEPQPTVAEAEPAALELIPETPPAVAAEAARLPGLETAEFEPPSSPPVPLGLEIETESDVELKSAGASEFSVPDASQDFAALAAKLNASRPRTPGRRASDRAAAHPQASQANAGPSAPAPRKQYSARETRGRSVAAFFQSLLLARPPEHPTASVGGEAEAAAPPATSIASGADGLVSFDDFFGTAAAGDSSVAPATGESGKDDLDQFHSWLQNLKR